MSITLSCSGSYSEYVDTLKLSKFANIFITASKTQLTQHNFLTHEQWANFALDSTLSRQHFFSKGDKSVFSIKSIHLVGNASRSSADKFLLGVLSQL